MIPPRIAIACLLLTPAWAVAVWPWSPWVALAPLAATHVLFLLSTLVPNSGLVGKTLNRLPVQSPSFHLTIDDGPDPADTEDILRILDRYRVRATFFLVGARAARHPELVRRILSAGHQVANHTQNHPRAWFWAYLPGAAKREILRGRHALEAAAGGALPRLFRTPVGLANPFVHFAAQSLGFRMVGWSARAFDSLPGSPERCAATVMRTLRPGAIILLHQGIRAPDGTPKSPQVIDTVLKHLVQAGFECLGPESMMTPSREERPARAAGRQG